MMCKNYCLFLNLPSFLQAAHAWAYMNYEAALFFRHQEQQKLMYENQMPHTEGFEPNISAMQDPPSFGSIKIVSVS